MILPQNGSVVIIDDDPKQALPIIKALSKSGISSTYYEGIKEHELPHKTCQNIRLAFVDLQLFATDNDEHIIATRIVNILQRIISPFNGPYVLLIWSLKTHQYSQALKNEIMKPVNNIVPTCIVELEKSKCIKKVTYEEDAKLNEFKNLIINSLKKGFEQEDLDAISNAIDENWIVDEHDEYEINDNAIQIIEGSIETELRKAGVFHLFVIWENLLKTSGSNAVTYLSSTVGYSEYWENNMRDVIHRLALARTGKNETTRDQAIKSSLSTLGSSFSEELESLIRDWKFPEYISLEKKYNISGMGKESVFQISKFEENGEKIKLLKDDKVVKSKEKISIKKINTLSNGLPDGDRQVVEQLVLTYTLIPILINTKLHLELNPSEELMPGNVYRIMVTDDVKKEYLKSYFANINGELNDYTFIELEISPICDYAQNKWKKSRLISGILYTATNSVEKYQNLYSVDPVLLIDKKISSLVFDFQLFKSVNREEVLKKELWFRIKREILLDISAHLSGHVNRPGISFVS